MDHLASFFGFKSQDKKQQQRPYQPPPTSQPRPATNRNNNYNNERPYILIQWKDQLKPFYLHPAQYHQYTTHDIKLQCKAQFHIPMANMTLQYNGGYLKDDQATLVSLGIQPSSILVVHGENVNAEQLQQTASGNEEEVGCLARIHKVMENAQPLVAKVKALENQQPLLLLNSIDTIDQHHQPQENGGGAETTTSSLLQEQKNEAMYISEMLVRALLTLDGVECPSSFVTARQERRAAVHFCQDLLDRVDKLKALYPQQKL
ncbi:hypothetical protein BJ944DRAFT_274138 [Cunninghamella echinulata]|nr:hypothetical protein BJ944DRAFT_274138 [Cunninghamella echinulata]